MKKIIKGLIALGCAIGLLIPSVVSASYMCHPRCCELYNLQKWYTVSYNEKVDSGFTTPWGTPMWTHVPTSVDISAWNAKDAALDLGLRAGYDCFVGFDRVNHDPVLYDYKVSFFGEDGWTVEYVQAENKNDAAGQFGLTVGYDCWVTKVF